MSPEILSRLASRDFDSHTSVVMPFSALLAHLRRNIEDEQLEPGLREHYENLFYGLLEERGDCASGARVEIHFITIDDNILTVIEKAQLLN